MEHLWLASSGVRSDILPYLILAVMMNRFLRRSLYWSRYLQPQRQDDRVLVMLQRMLYSESPFVDPEFRLRLMTRFGMAIFLMNGLMRPGVRVGFPVNRYLPHAFDRMKRRGFLSPPQQIQRAIAVFSNPSFQTWPFEISFSIEGFLDWDDQFRLSIVKMLLLSIPADFAKLPEFLALVRHLIVAENPFWNALVDVYNSDYLHRSDDLELQELLQCPDDLQKLLTMIKSSPDSEDLQNFVRLFQPAEHGQVLVPNDRDSFLQVIEQFMSCMIKTLPSLPGMHRDKDMIYLRSNQKLSPEGIQVSHRIMERLRRVHSLEISENLTELLFAINLEDSPKCLVYRAFELLLNLLKLIQESNGVIYTYMHACILIQTSTKPTEELCALRDLFTTVTFCLDGESSESIRYDYQTFCGRRFFLREYDDDRYKSEKFLLECLLQPDFLQTLKGLLQCSNKSNLDDFAAIFMKNLELVTLFRRYIQEELRTSRIA